jgi:ribosomal protein S18 acetylase RimI-like enzyme
MGARLLIRPAVDLDVADIARLHVKAWQVAYRGQIPDSYLDSLDVEARATNWSVVLRQPSTLVLIATRDDSLVGFCALERSRDPDAVPGVAELTAIYVDPAAARSGYGTALLSAAMAAAQARAFSQVSLWVLASNGSARAFYEARGFATDGTAIAKQHAGLSLDEIRYRRDIPKPQP